jgi:hypothetical protein
VGTVNRIGRRWGNGFGTTASDLIPLLILLIVGGVSFAQRDNYLRKWIDQLRWQRLPSFQKLAETLLKHLDGILNYCRTMVRFGVVEAINGNIRMLINRGRGYRRSWSRQAS